MSFRLIADENVEKAAIHYLRKLDHDVKWVGDVPELGLGAEDSAIAAYAREADRLVLTQDDDFFTAIDIDSVPGVLFQRDQSSRAERRAMQSTKCPDTSTSRT